jgi:uncharacterized membrane protein YdcZ (DUF606 family)
MTAVATVALAVGSTEAARLVHQKQNHDHPGWKQWKISSPMHPVIAGFSLGLFLFAAGIANERLATLLCLLIVVSALLVNGIPLVTVLTPKK